MTRNEAIKRLKEYAPYSYGIWHNDEEDTKAFDMAIEALSEPSIVRCKDCRWQGRNIIEGHKVCIHQVGMIDADNDSFCSYGKRREP